ncbi:hypothetical protein [Klebsiella pneumoniae]|uniref:hypothetical protein n=1 Tax=Klebsiella pneumoniae TaxID=573 RepID=UPI003B28C4CE
MADRGERAIRAARPERTGEPARAGDAIFVTQNEAGSRRGYYAGLTGLASVRELKTRQIVTEALESAGFEVAHHQKSSISIADPDGGRNIRLKEPSMNSLLTLAKDLGAEIEKRSSSTGVKC